MWMEVIKALPRKEDIENYLLNDEGVQAIEGMAKLPDKKGIKGAIERTKELSEGKGISSANVDKRKIIVENAKKLHKILTDILREFRGDIHPAKMRGRLAEILDGILEEEDMEAFKSFVGTAPLRTTKNPEERKKALKARQSDIETFIIGKEDEFYWIDTSTKKLQIKEKPPEYVKGKVTSSDEGYVLDLPDKMSLEDFRKFNSWFNDKKKTGSGVLGGWKSLSGRYELSPLVEAFGLLISRKAQETLNPYKEKKIDVNINTGEDALKYLELLVKPRWRKSHLFMPSPNLDSTGAIKSARKRLLMPHGKIIIPEVLKAIIGGASLDINALLEEGTRQTHVKLIPNQVRMVLLGQTPFDWEGEGIETMTSEEGKSSVKDNLISHFKDSKEIPKFYKKINRIGGREKQALDIIINSYQSKQNLFGEEEAKKIDSLISEDVSLSELKEALKEIYGIDAKSAFLEDLAELLESGEKSIFTRAGESYKLNMNLVEMDEKEKALFVNTFSNIKTTEGSIKVKIEKDNWSKIEEEYNEDYELSSVSGMSNLDAFHLLVLLDWYYGQTEFHDNVQDWLNPEEYEEEDVLFDEVKQSAIDNYSKIVDAFIEAIKKKVEDIAAAPEKYQDALVYSEKERDSSGRKTGKTTSKIGAMISELEGAEIVRVS